MQARRCSADFESLEGEMNEDALLFDDAFPSADGSVHCTVQPRGEAQQLKPHLKHGLPACPCAASTGRGAAGGSRLGCAVPGGV